MRGAATAILSFGLFWLGTSPLDAKSDTAKITIKGAALPSPVEITDQQIGQFSVWSGPGIRINGVEEFEGFIINWRQGAVEQIPENLRRVEVSFYAGAADQQPVYIVSYAYNPLTGEGYVYLPGKGDESYARNAATIVHGAQWEGHWFRATSTWETFVRPLIARARSASMSSRVHF